MPLTNPRLHSLAWFVAIGTAAAALHLGVVAALVEGWHWAPLWANPVGWATAWQLSFWGHRHLTFRATGAPLARSAGRFAALSAAGFAVNQGAYAALLHVGGWTYTIALAVVLVGVAVLTYVLGRWWAFRV